jgi:hypothetical protein
MTPQQKRIILQNIDTFSLEQIIDIIKSGKISLDEFIASGLNQNLVKQLKASLITQEERARIEKERNELIEKIKIGNVNAELIKKQINEGNLTFDDLKNMGIDNKLINSLKHYCNSNRTTMFSTVEQLPKMQEGRTDVYFIGVPGSGKSTMLSGILNSANKKGILMPDTYNNNGSVYQSQIISDLNMGVLPMATASGSYNYLPLSIKDSNEVNHPFNIVEVPGENFISMFNSGDVPSLLNYIKNKNKKIIIFVIDSLAQHADYDESSQYYDQNLVYTNILNMFLNNGVVEQTDAIYIVANKFDAINKNQNASLDEQLTIANQYLSQEYLSLINNCKNARSLSRNDFKIKVFPFSIGKVKFASIIEEFNNEYSTNIVNHLLEDSFVVRGGRFGKFFKTN